MADIIERLGLGTEVRELKLGASFTNDRSSAFHTLKYDFKPASVDETKVATVDVGKSNNMTVTVPHFDGSGTSHTIFKGSQKPHMKECVLIIDHDTGEITLERLSSNIQVKKTRGSALSSSVGMSSNVPPAPPSEIKKSPPSGLSKFSPPLESVQVKKSPPPEPMKSPTHSRTNSRTKVVCGKKKEPTFELPGKKVSGRFSPHSKKSHSPSLGSSTSPPMTQGPGSLPLIGLDDDFDMPSFAPATNTPATNSMKPTPQPQKLTLGAPQNIKLEPPAHSQLSDSSSSSSSSSSDSSDSSDNESDAPVAQPVFPKPTNERLPTLPENLLSDDLKLSESESDSD